MNTAVVGRLGAWRDRICCSRWLPWLARLAFAGRGLVYVVIGGFVLYTSVTTRPAEGWKQAFLAVREMPAGIPAVIALAVALSLFVTWRVLQALLDPESQARAFKGAPRRIAWGMSGIVYALLTFKVLRVLFHAQHASDDEARRHWTALVMRQPLGRWAVAAFGVGMVVFALVQIYRSMTLNVGKRLGRADEDVAQWVASLGRVGLVARAVVFAVIGAFFVFAAWYYDPQQAQAMAGALQAIERQPYGAWLLGLVAIGLLGFGLFGVAEAFLRRLNCR